MLPLTSSFSITRGVGDTQCVTHIQHSAKGSLSPLQADKMFRYLNDKPSVHAMQYFGGLFSGMKRCKPEASHKLSVTAAECATDEQPCKKKRGPVATQRLVDQAMKELAQPNFDEAASKQDCDQLAERDGTKTSTRSRATRKLDFTIIDASDTSGDTIMLNDILDNMKDLDVKKRTGCVRITHLPKGQSVSYSAPANKVLRHCMSRIGDDPRNMRFFTKSVTSLVA